MMKRNDDDDGSVNLRSNDDDQISQKGTTGNGRSGPCDCRAGLRINPNIASRSSTVNHKYNSFVADALNKAPIV